MKALPKITLGVVAILSLCSCGKGSKTTKEKFFEKANAIESTKDYKKARISGTLIEENTENSETKKTKENLIGTFTKDEWGSWAVDDEKNVGMAKEIFDFAISNYITDFSGKSGLTSNDSTFTEKYYLRPFGYELTYKESDDYYGDYYDYKRERTNEGSYYFQWNDDGWLVIIEASYKSTFKINGQTRISSGVVKAKIVYK